MKQASNWPALGLGTWRMGEAARTRSAEVAAVRLAIELGYRLIDSAEMYGDGGAEEVVGAAVADALRAGDCKREDLVIVSKVLPSNASRRGVVAASERSRARLGVDEIDLYLLHWPGPHPLRDTVEAFEQLQTQGAIKRWGVSNFDRSALNQLMSLPGGERCAANQVYYSLGERGIEFDLKPWQQQHSMPLMAYSPIDQSALAGDTRVAALAAPLGLTAAQLALAWTLRDGNVIAIPKAVREPHLRENFAARSITLDAITLAALDTLFPPPRKAQPLAVT